MLSVSILPVCTTSHVFAAVQPLDAVPVSSYGVVSKSDMAPMSEGTANIQVSSNVNAPFYVEKLLLTLQNPGQADLLLQSVSLDGVYTYSLTNYLGARVVVIPNGVTIGDVISSLPTSLSLLMVKDPLGNTAAFATGGTDGLVFTVGYSTPVATGGQVDILALILAPTNATVTLTIS